MSQPLVSVVIPVYNGERYLGEAIASVLAQAYTPLELIVADDGSTDGSAQVARNFGEPVRCLECPHAGQAAALNRGILDAGGEFLAFVDSDDLWTPGKLARQLDEFARHPHLDMIFGHARQFYSPELRRGAERLALRDGAAMPAMVIGGMLIRSAAFHRVGLLNESLRVGEFIDWHARAMDLGLHSATVPEITLERRIHGANLGIRQRGANVDYLAVVKAALDRRRGNPA
jgi:glycosyltransferase involved in cell wall biosynthesis